MASPGEQQHRLRQRRQVRDQEHGGGQQEAVPLHGREDDPRLRAPGPEVHPVLLLHRGHGPGGLQGNNNVYTSVASVVIPKLVVRGTLNYFWDWSIAALEHCSYATQNMLLLVCDIATFEFCA